MITFTTPARAIAAIPAGSRVLATPSCCTPQTLLTELGRVAADIGGLSLASGLMLGAMPYLEAVKAGHLPLRSWHVVAGLRDVMRDGQAQYVPLRASDVPHYLPGSFDVLLVRLPPPDARGYCSLGPSASWTRVALDNAKLVIAEIDPGLPWLHGEASVHVSELHHVVEADTPTIYYPSATPTETSERIAAAVVDLVPRDATVQLGIGAIPESVAGHLAQADLGHLRFVGLGCDSMITALERGPRWTRHTHEPTLLCVEMMGTRPLFDVSDRNPSVLMIPSTRCHDPLWIAAQPRFMSINSAVEMDLSGQVASETVGGRVMSGVGGSMDFFEGSHWSDGGRRVIALQATTPDGRISKIVPSLAPGTPVTIPRHCVDIVVTEFGVARLFGRSLRERAEALIAIAAPQFRDELSAQLG